MNLRTLLKNQIINKNGWIIKIIASFLAGLLLLFFPEKSLNICCYIIAAAFFAYAIWHLILYIRKEKSKVLFNTEPFKFTVGFVLAFISLFILPAFIRIVPLVIGLILLIEGLEYVIPAFSSDGFRGGEKIFYAIFGIGLMTFGVVCMFSTAFITSWLIKFTGIFLIINAVFTLIDAIFIKKKKLILKKKSKYEHADESEYVVIESVETSEE